MASKKTLNAKNLEALGAERLAGLLIGVGKENAAAKRLIRMELADAAGPGELARDIRKRLAAIAQVRSSIDRRRAGKIAKDLDVQRRAIVEQLAESDPGEALELLWRFLALAESVYRRSDDDYLIEDKVGDVFRDACGDIGAVTARAGTDPVDLADRIFDAIFASRYHEYVPLIAIAAPALGTDGMEHLKQRMLALLGVQAVEPGGQDRGQAGPPASGAAGADGGHGKGVRAETARRALRAIADDQGDVDAFVAQHGEEDRNRPHVAAEIARRLLAAGRAGEALAAIDGVDDLYRRGWEGADSSLEDIRIEALDALGRSDDAQRVRWGCFERSLSPERLRAYLDKQPDFEDQEAEAKALDFVEGYGDRRRALEFLVSWPAPGRAARLVIANAGEFKGGRYDELRWPARSLADSHPLAATLLFRAMIDFTLSNKRSDSYNGAVGHLLECARLSPAIEDYGEFGTHEAYAAGLLRDHGRNWKFWKMLDEAGG